MLYQRIVFSTGVPDGEPAELPAQLVGFYDSTLANLPLEIDPPLPGFEDTAFLPYVAPVPTPGLPPASTVIRVSQLELAYLLTGPEKLRFEAISARAQALEPDAIDAAATGAADLPTQRLAVVRVSQRVLSLLGSSPVELTDPDTITYFGALYAQGLFGDPATAAAQLRLSEVLSGRIVSGPRAAPT